MDFVKEGKLEQEQARKQAEWERVRKADDPIGWWKTLNSFLILGWEFSFIFQRGSTGGL